MKNSFKNTLKNKKGQAGLEIFLGVVVSLFIIGLLVFIFNYMGSEIEKDVYDSVTEWSNLTAGSGTTIHPLAPSGTWSAYNTSNGTRATPVIINGLGNALNFSGNTITAVGNLSSAEIELRNFQYMGTTAKVMNETRGALRNTTDWFGVIITITAMVVLILLVTLIIRAIRGSGLQGGGEGRGGEGGEGGSQGSA